MTPAQREALFGKQGTGKILIEHVPIRPAPQNAVSVPCANGDHEACGGMHCECECRHASHNTDCASDVDR